VGSCRVLQWLRRVDQEAGQAAGDLVLEFDVVVAEHRQRDDDHHRAHRDLQADAAASQRRGHPPPTQHQEVEDDRRADPVAERDGETAGGEGLRSRDGDHSGKDRPGAGRVDEAEAGPDCGSRPETVAAGLNPGATGKTTHRRLDPRRQRRDHQGDAKDDQDDDRQLAQQIVGQAERRDHVDQCDRREGEGDGEAGDDAKWPPPTAGSTCRERDRQHRQHAGRERRRRAGDEPEQDQQNHALNPCS